MPRRSSVGCLAELVQERADDFDAGTIVERQLEAIAQAFV
jgi:hypothetical protein